LLALMLPLIHTYAGERTQDLFVKRLGEVTRFAVLAENSLEGDDFGSLTTDLERYADVYGGTVVVVNANRAVVAASGGDVDVDRPDVSTAIDRALSGAGARQPETAWPWADSSFVVGSPVGRDAQVLGAVVMISPTDSVQADVTRRLGWLVIAGLAVLVLTAYGLVNLLVRWIIRPVHDLDRAAKRLAHGDLASRVPHQTGPPEIRALATSFNVMADNVEISQRQQRELIADASHQLGNPLTALRLRVENLGASADPSSADHVAKVLEESDRLNRIVESLLDLSQVGGQNVATTRVDIAARARHRCDMWSPMFDRLRVHAPALAPASATNEIVDVVLDALLDNAAKFAAGSPVDVAVATADDGSVGLSVRDHGPGLDAEDIAKVGARFFRGRQHQNVPGTGLGLAIVRARVLDIGGAFAVVPAAGGGLQVETWFPGFSDPSPGSTATTPDAVPVEK
ncbi:MAG TPA: HAMP domain-containing sensor histidine kinase, partial [Jiangellaceae bacterium]|nr:HAMP domain-containing sensor histidine kinase [Jiangellaceae bacterium]